jgi:anaerobic C4-dicarboxylate transporter
MALPIVLQFVVGLAATWMGARFSGVGPGLRGAVGLPVVVATGLFLAKIMFRSRAGRRRRTRSGV